MNTLIGKQFIALAVAALLILGLLSGCQNEEKKKDDAVDTAKTTLDFTNADTEAAYTIGNNVGRNLFANVKSLEDLDLNLSHDIVTQGFIDGLAEKSELDDETLAAAMKTFEERVRTLVTAKEQQMIKESEETNATYLKENGAKEGVVTLPSGLQYKVLTASEGAKPGATDKVKVHYSGTLTDGTKFDSSYDRNLPATFVVGGVIKGWTEALQLMSVGSKWQLTIPGDLAYGEQGRPGKIPPNATLLFDVELLEINPSVEAPKDK